MLKADLHIHTEYSMDCRTSLHQIIGRCVETGIDCIAVTDHGTAEGALKMRELAPFRIIVGQEVLTEAGELMGLFLKETVPNKLTVEDTIKIIRSQGGLVAIPHPLDRLRTSALHGSDPAKLLPKVDILEAFNARDLMARNTDRVRDLAKKYHLRVSCGSDAHTAEEIGRTYMEMEYFKTPQDFLRSLSNGKIVGRKSSILVHVTSTVTHLLGKRRARTGE